MQRNLYQRQAYIFFGKSWKIFENFAFHVPSGLKRSSKYNLDTILSSGLAEVTPQKFRFLFSTTDERIGNRSIT